MSAPRRRPSPATAAADAAQLGLFDNVQPTTAEWTAEAVLARLAAWREAGWLRALDLALPRWLHSLAPHTPASLLLASAWLTHLEGRGHSTLPLPALAAQGPALLAWPAEAQADLAAMWPLLPTDAAQARAAWAGCPALSLVEDEALLDPLHSPSEADPHATPLVLDGPRLYLRRYWRHEQRIARQIATRATGPGIEAPPPLDQARALMTQLFPPRTTPAEGGSPATDWQAVACALALRQRLTVITGGPGTGKTYTAARLLVLLQALHAGPAPLRVGLAAPTGKAAARLKQSLDQALQALPPALAGVVPQAPTAATLHQWLGVQPGTRRFRHHAQNPLPLGLLFVDEASMVHLEMMDALLDALPPGARLVLLGDRDQLASVEAGAVLADLCPAQPDALDAATRAWVQQLSGQALPEAPPPDALNPEPLAGHTVRLRESRRFDGPIGITAQAVNQGDAAAALAVLTAHTRLENTAEQAAPGPAWLARHLPHGPAGSAAVAALAVQGRPAQGLRKGHAPGYAHALAALRQRPGNDSNEPDAFRAWALGLLQALEDCRVLCAVREGPWGVQALNTAIEQRLRQQGLLPNTGGEWYEGRPVMVTRNAPALGVFNGDIGLVLRPPGAAPGPANAAGPAPALRAYFAQGPQLHSVSVARLPPVDTAFALTVHKSQGSEFGHVLLVLPEADSPVLTRELLYTGITRARQALSVLAPEPQRLHDACQRLTQRFSGLRTQLRREGTVAAQVNLRGEDNEGVEGHPSGLRGAATLG